MVELRETAEGGGGIGTGVVVVESPLSNIEAKRDENPRGEGKGDPTIEIGQPEVERPGPQEQGPRKDDEKKASSSGRGHETTEEIEKRLLGEGVFDENFVSLKDDVGEELLPEILNLYISDGEETLGSLVQLSNGGDKAVDFPEIQKLIHRFKGSSLNIGIAQMCGYCKDIRKLCVEKNAEETKRELASMREGFLKVKEELESYIESLLKRKRHKPDA